MNLILKDQLPLPLDHLEGVYAPSTERAIKSDTAIYWVSCPTVFLIIIKWL
jgi:hypothetical protein